MNKEQSIKFIEKCKLDGRKIFGIERFYFSEGGKIPDLMHIADFSEATAQLSISNATKFIKDAPDGYFEFDVK